MRKVSKLLTEARTIVLNAVRSVFQTYVESLKASGSFDESAQKLALEKARNIVISLGVKMLKNT